MNKSKYSIPILLFFTTSTLLVSTVYSDDVDKDGIKDSFDNCIKHPNPEQRDSDADGFGNSCDGDFNNDLRVDIDDIKIFESVYKTRESPHQDLNGNGFVGPQDRRILKSLVRRSPGPAGKAVYPLTASDTPAISTEPVITTRCSDSGLATYLIEGDITLTDSSPATSQAVENFYITLTNNQGETINTQVDAEQSYYSITLQDATISSLRQEQLSISTEANQAVLGYSETLLLEGCYPPTAAFDISNGPVDDSLPPVLGTEEGTANEVDIIHLGGSPNGPTQSRIVAVAGTGAGARMYSYTLDSSTLEPVSLGESESFAGLDLKLLTLSDDLSPDLTVDPFVAALRLDGNLWLRTWQITGDGSFLHFAGRGYGENAKATVEAYALAHRILDDGNYQVVSAVRTDEATLRFVTWWIDRSTGEIYGRYDSGDFGDPATDSELAVSHLDSGLFVVSYTNTAGRLANHYWQVDSNGYPISSGSMASGLNLQGTNTAVAQSDAAINLPILSDDFITPVFFRNDTNNDVENMRVYVWETRETAFTDSGFLHAPYRISNSERDLSPDQLGILLSDNPTPTTSPDAPPGVRAMLVDDKVADFNFSSGELFSQMPPNELVEVQMASVTKVMVLLLAVEAINNGSVALSDEVTISEGAGEVGGSKVGTGDDGLVPDEVQNLELLLHGMMLTSGNDAAAAIAEHVGGTVENFITLMNQRANELDMNNTTYWVPNNPFGGPGGGGTSTPEDQIKLWRYARDIPLFAELASASTYFGCGEDPDGNEKCWGISKFNDSGYPGLNGWKGGNGGFTIDQYTNIMNGPFCIGSGCLIAESYRMDRALIVGLQNSGKRYTSDRWDDADELFDFGFRQQFTPDKRGSGNTTGWTADFALDGVGELITVTLHIDNSDQSVQLCSWSTLVDSGSITQNSCNELLVSGLAASNLQAVPAIIDAASLGSAFADGDYIIGHRNLSSWLQLDLWRVGNLQP